MEKISKKIQEKVGKKPDGAVFALEDVLPKNSTQSEYFRAVKTISKLQQEKRISRVRKGLYFKPMKLKYMDLVITKAQQEEIADYYVKKFRNKAYLTGAPLFNGLGLTEQVAISTILAVENPPKDFRDERLFFIKAKCPITDKNRKYLQYLDCIEQVDNVSAKQPGEVVDSLMNLYISKLSDGECSELVRYSKYYSPKTRAILASIFDTLEKKDFARQLRLTYNANSRFELYIPNSKTLLNKENYGIYHAY
jgi:hypothetical protein